MSTSQSYKTGMYSIDLFWEPELAPPNVDPRQQFTRANHLAFDVAPEVFDQVVVVLPQSDVTTSRQPFKVKFPICKLRVTRYKSAPPIGTTD